MPGTPVASAYCRSICQTTFSPKRFACHPVGSVHRPENIPIRATRRGRPGIDRNLHPGGHRHSADAAVLANHIDDAPAVIALLHMRVSERRDLRPTKAAAEKNGEDGGPPRRDQARRKAERFRLALVSARSFSLDFYLRLASDWSRPRELALGLPRVESPARAWRTESMRFLRRSEAGSQSELEGPRTTSAEHAANARRRLAERRTRVRFSNVLSRFSREWRSE
jgi:hypothetical protein